MTDQEQIDALKAQVNCLRVALEVIEDENSDECKGLSLIAKTALELTPQQCISKVKAKAIEDATLRADDGSGWCFEGDLSRFAKTLREQAK